MAERTLLDKVWDDHVVTELPGGGPASAAITAGSRTADIAQPGEPTLSTREKGDAVLAELERGCRPSAA